jgi:HK97 gp10 family phage protein
MQIHMTVTGAEEVLAKLQHLEAAARGELLLTALTAGGELISNAAKGYAPVKTGNLRRSIHVEPGEASGSGASVQIGTNVSYSRFVELGTRHMSARPYLRPAADGQKAAVLNEVKTSLWDLLRAQLG